MSRRRLARLSPTPSAGSRSEHRCLTPCGILPACVRRRFSCRSTATTASAATSPEQRAADRGYPTPSLAPSSGEPMSQTTAARSPFALLGRPLVARLLASSLLGRLPTGMVPVALVLFSRGSDVGYGVAGLFAAAYTAGSAVGGPVLARWMDRTGQTRVIVGAGVVCSIALGLLPL